MPITAIDRYFVGDPNIVAIVTTDDFASITASGYIDSQREVINALINGDFQWSSTDIVLIHYSPNTVGFFVRDITNDTFVSLNPSGAGAPLTRVNDTNVTLTLGGTPTSALLQATSITAGWTGTLSATRGGLGVSNPTAHGILVGEGSSAANPIVLGAGEVLIGTTASDPSAATLTEGTGISIVSASGAITISATGGSSLSWSANSSSTISAAVNNGYILTSGSSTTVNLPTTFAVGDSIGIAGQGAAWTMAIGAATNIKAFGNTYTTSIASTNNSDTIVLVATVANTTWGILSMGTTGFTAS